jgi:hypothetical protein
MYWRLNATAIAVAIRCESDRVDLIDPLPLQLEHAERVLLDRANGKRRERIVEPFEPGALHAKITAESFGAIFDDGGGVAARYNYPAHTTRQMIAWVTEWGGEAPVYRVRLIADSIRVSGRHVPALHNGNRAPETREQARVLCGIVERCGHGYCQHPQELGFEGWCRRHWLLTRVGVGEVSAAKIEPHIDRPEIRAALAAGHPRVALELIDAGD